MKARQDHVLGVSPTCMRPPGVFVGVSCAPGEVLCGVPFPARLTSEQEERIGKGRGRGRGVEREGECSRGGEEERRGERSSGKHSLARAVVVCRGYAASAPAPALPCPCVTPPPHPRPPVCSARFPVV